MDDLIALMDQIWGSDSIAHVAGWSFGSILALNLARAYEHRVDRLVLVASGYYEPQPMEGTPPRAGLVANHSEIFGEDWQWVRDLSSYAFLSTEERCRRTLIHADIR